MQRRTRRRKGGLLYSRWVGSGGDRVSWAAVSARHTMAARSAGLAARPETSIWACSRRLGRRGTAPAGQHFGRGEQRDRPWLGLDVGRQRAIARSTSMSLVWGYFHAPRPAPISSMALIWLITAGAVRRPRSGVRCSARKPAVASYFRDGPVPAGQHATCGTVGIQWVGLAAESSGGLDRALGPPRGPDPAASSARQPGAVARPVPSIPDALDLSPARLGISIAAAIAGAGGREFSVTEHHPGHRDRGDVDGVGVGVRRRRRAALFLSRW